MKVAKGIKGIRKFLADKAHNQGWHVFAGETYLGYQSLDVYEISEALKNVHGHELEFKGWTGNGVHFA